MRSRLGTSTALPSVARPATCAARPSRNGFTREGIQREAEWLYDHFVDLASYALLRSEWKPAFN